MLKYSFAELNNRDSFVNDKHRTSEILRLYFITSYPLSFHSSNLKKCKNSGSLYSEFKAINRYRIKNHIK